MAIIRNVNNSGERYTRLQLYLTHGIQRAMKSTISYDCATWLHKARELP